MNFQDFLKIAAKEAQKSGCLRGKRGAVFVDKDKVLIKTYNKIYPVNNFCQKHSCLRDKLKLGLGKEAERCRSIHAEAWAVCLAARKGIVLKGAVAYITSMPCINCAKLMLAVGIKEVYYLDIHADQMGTTFLKKMGVKCMRAKLPGDDPKKRLRDIRGQ